MTDCPRPRSTSRLDALAPWVLLALAAACAGLAVSPSRSAGGATARSLGFVSGMTEDGLRNYDFTSQVVSATNVDWTISLLFWNNANVNRVKNALNGRYGSTGSRENGRVRDSAPTSGAGCDAWCWDTDGGRKTSFCPVTGTADHYRLYAPPGSDRLYSVRWGYYLVGSVHQDHAECGSGTWFGNSEPAEQSLVDYWVSLGRPAQYDGVNGNNAEPPRIEGDHRWNSDGLVSTLRTD